MMSQKKVELKKHRPLAPSLDKLVGLVFAAISDWLRNGVVRIFFILSNIVIKKYLAIPG